MKKTIFLSFVILLTFPLFGQDFMDTITEECCTCLQNSTNKPSTMNKEVELGLCILEAASPYEKQLKKHYDIDMAKIETEAEKLGHILGLKMATKCPEILLQMVDEVEGREAIDHGSKITGKVTKVHSETFVSLSIKESTGKVTEVYWLNPISSSFEMQTDYKKLEGIKVQVYYKEEEFFDARINTYRPFKVITQIEVATY